MKRRDFLQSAALTAALSQLARGETTESPTNWSPRYLLSSCMYGKAPLEEILPEVSKTGSQAIDIWPEPHGNQREQLDAMDAERFARLLEQHEVPLGCLTQYPLGPFGLTNEMALAKRLGCRTMVTGSQGPKGLSGAELKQAVRDFANQMRPHLQVAQQAGVTIAIENHGNSLIQSPDSVRWLLEYCDDPHLGIALAPYHLPQDPRLLADLVRDCGDRLAVFYAWQHGRGCMQKLPKEQELLQLPGRGELKFAPIMKALAEIDYAGWVSIFMHPVPRGIPILPTTEQVSAEINRAREYLDRSGSC